MLGGCGLDGITPHVLRHSFANIANDLGFTETTVAALLGHAKGSVTDRYIPTMDAALIAAADTVAGYVPGLLDGAHYKLTAYAVDHASRKHALAIAAGEIRPNSAAWDARWETFLCPFQICPSPARSPCSENKMTWERIA
ncbi:MAG TPA: site-specific integrase [Sphingopyxis sp.]|nr:site-specific integrase [Sphingopyxis sp.]